MNTNPAYVPAAGDLFALFSPGSSNGVPVGAVTVVSGSGHTFLATNGESYDTKSENVGVWQTPNVSAVAALGASPTNTGTGVITGVGVAGPTLHRSSPVLLILFTSAIAWVAKNPTGGVIASGAYADPTTISLLGVSVSISGAPGTGDSFTITPTGG